MKNNLQQEENWSTLPCICLPYHQTGLKNTFGQTEECLEDYGPLLEHIVGTTTGLDDILMHN